MKSSLKAKSIALLLAVATIFSSVFSADYIVADAEETTELPDTGRDTLYSDEDPFLFPTEVGGTKVLEAECATIQEDIDSANWPLGVSEGTWASGGKFLNSLNNGDSIKIPYIAGVAGVYSVTVTYRSGSPTNYLAWSEADNKIVAGTASAGASDNAENNHTATFDMVVATSGAGSLIFAPITADSPQLDKFDIVLVASKTQLGELITKADAVSEADYTVHAYEALTTELETARAVYADENATADEINIAIYALENAIAGLVPNSIEIYVGESITFRNNAGNYAGENVTTDIATVTMAGVNKYESREITAIDSLVDGGKYWIKNKRANRLLTKSQMNNGLKLEGEMTAGWVEDTDLLEHLWTVRFVTNAAGTRYLVEDGESNYLNMSENGNAGLVDNPSESFTILNNGDDVPWRFKQDTNRYLNQFGGSSSQMAAAWANDNAGSDEGSKWYMYECVDRSYTDITFTGASAGTTQVVLGEENYNITVKDASVNYVVDFGLPVTFDLSGEGYELNTGVINTDAAKVTVAEGNLVTYELGSPLQGVDTVMIPTNIDGVTATINVYPATSVYYEENFMKETVAEGQTAKWTSVGNRPSAQTAEQLGSSSNYGYDSIYNGANLDSTYAHTTVSGAKGTFTFTGTGVDIYANCNANTGLMMVLVREQNDDGTDGNLVKMMTVDTRLSKGTTDTQLGDAAYGVPVVSIPQGGLDYDTYTVSLIYVAQSGEKAASDGIMVDGFRVYGTLTDETVYQDDEEDNMSYAEIRDALLVSANVTGSIYETSTNVMDQINNSESSNGVILLTGESYTPADLKDFLDNSSKNELYLYPGQKVVFTLTAGVENPQIGMKAVADSVTYSINGGEEQTLNAKTEMYYQLTITEGETGRTFAIENAGETGILSVTKLKASVPVTRTVFAEMTEETVLAALQNMEDKENPDAGEDNTPLVNPFVDVTADDYFHNAVLWALENKITAGTTATTFEPNATCTRAEVVAFLYKAAGSPAVGETKNPFTDVSSDVYYYNAVLWALENKITAGTTATTFEPDATVTRGEVVEFLHRVKGNPATVKATCEFTDVAGDSYYYDAVLWAAENGITAGTTATTFAPGEGCTRGQVVTFLYNAR